MFKENVKIKAGTVLIVDHGEYSDYCIMGMFVVEKDFIPYDILMAHLLEHPEDTKEYAFNEDRFLNKLSIEGYLSEIPYDRLYLGGYGCHLETNYFPFHRIDHDA